MLSPSFGIIKSTKLICIDYFKLNLTQGRYLFLVTGVILLINSVIPAAMGTRLLIKKISKKAGNTFKVPKVIISNLNGYFSV